MNLVSREKDKALKLLKKVSPMSFQWDEQELCSLGFFSLFKQEDKVSPELSTPPQTSAIKILSTSAFDKSSNLLRFFPSIFRSLLSMGAFFRCFYPFRWI